MQIDQISAMVKRTAKQEILPRFRNLQDGDISAKSPGDMVSIADTEAEKALSRELNRLMPSAIVGGEEIIAEQPELLEEIKTAELAFLIDPVDGTNNFIKGDVRFALMLTALRQGEVVAAWIYLPVRDLLAVCEKGSGCFLGGKAIKISAADKAPFQMIGAAHINRFPDEMKRQARENVKKFRENRPAFCAGHDYVALLEGARDFSLYYRTLPWDHLPGGLLYGEAGGYVRLLQDEQGYTIHDQYKGLLSAATADQWHLIRDTVFPGCY